MALGLLTGELNHLRGGVDSQHLGGAVGKEEGETPVACSEVGDDLRGHETEESFSHGLPGFTGNVILAVTAGDAVKESAHFVLTLFDDTASGCAVGDGFGDFFLGPSEEVGEDVVSIAGGEAVEAVLPDSAVLYQSSLLQLRKVRGNRTLTHDEDFLQFGDRKLFGLQEQEDAEPVGIGYDAEYFHN